METQLTVSHQWLSQMEQDGICYIYLFDNGEPLLFQSIHRSEYRDQLLEAAITKARDEDVYKRQEFQNITKNSGESSNNSTKFFKVGKRGITCQATKPPPFFKIGDKPSPNSPFPIKLPEIK